MFELRTQLAPALLGVTIRPIADPASPRFPCWDDQGASFPSRSQGRTLSEAFPVERRLQKRALFLEAQRVGVRVRAAHFHFVVRRGSDGASGRLGIVVTRKLGCAVVRNRVKRWCREVFRRTEPRLPPGTDLVAIVRGPADALSYASTKAEWTGVWPLILKRAEDPR